MTEETIAQSTVQTAPPNLQINDLVKILEILNVVSQRGAIRPEEFSVVGGIYDRIFQFLTASGVFNTDETSDEESDKIDKSQTE